MRGLLKILFSVGLICLVVSKNEDFHLKLGKDLYTAMQKITLNLFKENIESTKKFYKEASFDMGLDMESNNKLVNQFKELKTELNEINKKIPNDFTDLDQKKVVELFKEYAAHHLNIVRMEADATTKDQEQKEALYFNVANYIEIEAQATDNAFNEMQQKWTELYKTIPVDELKNHAEYAQINESMEKLSKIDRRHMKTPMERGDAFKALFKQMANFFNWIDWKNYLEVNNY